MSITLQDHADGHSSVLDPEMLVLNKEKEKLNAFRDQFEKETVTVCFSEGAASPEYGQEFTRSHTYIHRQGTFGRTWVYIKT